MPSIVPSVLDGPDNPALETSLEFEMFLSNLAARLLEVAPEELDSAISESLGGLGVLLDGDRGGIAQFSEDRRSLHFTHPFARSGATTVLFGEDLAAAHPWYAAELRAGRPVIVPRVPEGVPIEATAEWAYAADVGLKSHLSLPLTAGGEVLGALGVDHLTEYRSWSPEFVSRLELLASLYANALYRRRARARLRRAADLNRSVLASVASEIVVLDEAGRVVAVNEAWTRSRRRQRYPQETLSAGTDYLERIERAAGGDPRGALIVSGIRSVLSGEKERFEGRYPYPDPAGDRAYLLTATPRSGGNGGGVVVYTDVTELQETKRRLERSLAELRELKERLEAENVVLQQQARRAQGFDELVGTSAALGRVLTQVEQVAPTDAPVLLLGETGTGKDMVARALHERSRRRERPLVTVNCAALPATLVESELFGYEKGAFTGALQRTIGRFEVARGGTLFLDEIGELPLEVQAKLLRVLQTGEFERLGSPKTLKADVRLLAATNRDLAREVREGRFRADLFYRLSVFPIALPPLRERREDIPLLVWSYIARRQAAIGRSVKRVPERLMRAFTAYAWPGNVRELENVVERALIMTSAETLAADPAFLEAAPAVPALAPKASLAEAERVHIRAVLDECGWKISGKGNAADRLGLNRSTLQFRMKKLGLGRPERGA
jgi:transcriptional regulator with GAF, ATPase, and Fis domain